MRSKLKRFMDVLSRNSLGGLLEREKYATELRGSARYAAEGCLTRHEHRVFSQNGEDGAIREILSRVEHGRYFVEIGSGDGSENNTAFLLLQGWSGLWIEGNRENVERARTQFARPIAAGQLEVVEAFVTAENINALLSKAAERSVDVLSLDVDLNTYHVWEAMALRPRVSIVEYNPLFPPGVDWKADYAPDGWWNGTTYYGASLTALANLASARGESLVGCDLTGTNAYFVRTELCGRRFLAPGDVAAHYEPSRNYLQGRPAGHPRHFAG